MNIQGFQGDSRVPGDRTRTSGTISFATCPWSASMRSSYVSPRVELDKKGWIRSAPTLCNRVPERECPPHLPWAASIPRSRSPHPDSLPRTRPSANDQLPARRSPVLVGGDDLAPRIDLVDRPIGPRSMSTPYPPPTVSVTLGYGTFAVATMVFLRGSIRRMPTPSDEIHSPPLPHAMAHGKRVGNPGR